MTPPTKASTSPRTVDPYKKGHFTVQLSERITEPSRNASTKYTSVKFNHKPSQTGKSRTTTITPADSHDYNLTIEDAGDDQAGTYLYKGRRTNSKTSYVLIFDPSKQTCTLEPVSEGYTFNLRSAPWEQSASKLAQQYPQLQPPKEDKQDEQGDLFDQDDFINGGSDAEPDPNNPYDYRHFLNSQDLSHSPVLTGSATNTPKSEAVRKTPIIDARRPPTSAPTAKAVPASKPQSVSGLQKKRPKSPPIPAARNTKAPAIRLDRRAYSRPSELSFPKPSARVETPSDSDHDSITATTIELSSNTKKVAPTSQPVTKATTLASLPVGLDDTGPISLRSAANSASPHSRLHTPARPQADDDEDVIDFGDTTFTSRRAANEDEDEDEDEDDAEGEEDDGYDEDNEEEEVELDGDMDVEPIELPPPAQPPPAIDEPETTMQESEDDEDLDFMAEMMQELASQEEEEEEEEEEAGAESEEDVSEEE